MTLSRVQPVVNFMNGHLDEELTLQVLATLSGISPFHLHRVFTAATGETAKHFATRLKLDRATLLLTGTKRPIVQIALDCGYSSHEVFCRAFRKRFGLSPSQYRARGFHHPATPEQERAHEHIIGRTGPCIGLFHRGDSGPKGGSMDYSIATREIAPQPAIVKRKTMKPDEIANNLGQMFQEVFLLVQQKGIVLAGAPFARYMEWGPGLLTLDAGFPVAAEFEGEEPTTAIRGETLPGGMVATTIHTGDYKNLTQAHAALQVWIRDQGLKPRGPAWESYVTDPAHVPDPKDWQTELFWPVESAKS